MIWALLIGQPVLVRAVVICDYSAPVYIRSNRMYYLVDNSGQPGLSDWATAQLWRVTSLGDGFKLIVSHRFAQLQDDAGVLSFSFITFGKEQYWTFAPARPGFFFIRSYQHKYLAESPGQNVEIRSGGSVSSSQWEILAETGGPACEVQLIPTFTPTAWPTSLATPMASGSVVVPTSEPTRFPTPLPTPLTTASQSLDPAASLGNEIFWYDVTGEFAESPNTAEVSCPDGTVLTGCTCIDKCAGAAVSGQTCFGYPADMFDGVATQARCATLPTTSAWESVDSDYGFSVEVSCNGNLAMTACNCISLTLENHCQEAIIVKHDNKDVCSATSKHGDAEVLAQARCVDIPGASSWHSEVSEAYTGVVEATCPQRYTLTSCVCNGISCKGAYSSVNTCTASGDGYGGLTAVARCVEIVGITVASVEAEPTTETPEEDDSSMSYPIAVMNANKTLIMLTIQFAYFTGLLVYFCFRQQIYKKRFWQRYRLYIRLAIFAFVGTCTLIAFLLREDGDNYWWTPLVLPVLLSYVIYKVVHVCCPSVSARLRAMADPDPEVFAPEGIQEEEADDADDPDTMPDPSILPGYWTNSGRDVPASFDHMAYVPAEQYPVFDKLLNQTHRNIVTQDRLCPKPMPETCPRTPGGCPCVQPHGDPGMPTGYAVRRVIRVEDSSLWQAYVNKRDLIREKRKGEAIHPFDPPCMTDAVVDQSGQVLAALDREINEVYLWHGTFVRSALSIAQDDFRIDLAGSNAGTMYGRGVYMAESSTKADEYAKDEPRGYYKGIYVVILCRVVMGKMYYTTQRDEDAGDRFKQGETDSTMGDRAKGAGTFREFVVYDNDQVYPEYVLLYSRMHAGDSLIAAQAEAGLKPFQMELPVYWASCHRNPASDTFDAQYRVMRSTRGLMERLARGAAKDAANLRVVDAFRVEDSEMWMRYIQFKQKVWSKLRAQALANNAIASEGFVADDIDDDDPGDDYRLLCTSPEFPEDKEVTHLHFKCEWKDSGRADHAKKCRVMACLMRDDVKLVEHDLFGACRANGVADWYKVEAFFSNEDPILKRSRAGDQIIVMYTVGEGDGRELHIRSFEGMLVQMPDGHRSVRGLHCTPPNEVDGDPDSGHAITLKLMQEIDAEDAISSENLDASVNELMLWHGTSKLAADSICKAGFRIPKGDEGKHGKRFGAGAYFAEDLDKSLTYCQKDDEDIYHVLLCRVACGEIYYTEEGFEDDAHTKAEADGKTCVLANPAKEGPREFIMLQECQVYPEFILHVKTD